MNILKLANTDAGRYLLKTRGKVVKITPNSYHIRLGKDKYQAVFFPTNKIEQIFQPIVDKIEIANSEWGKVDTYKAFLHYAGLERYNYPQIYLDSLIANPAGANVNKRYYIDANATWAGAHDATSAPVEQDNGIVQAGFVGGQYYVSRVANNFLTSSLTSAATISAAIIELYHVDNGSNANADTTASQVVSHTPTTAPDYTAGDLDPAKWGTTVFASINLASITLNAYNTYTLDANGILNISKTGYSNFGYRNSRDTANSAPTGGNRVDHQGASQPKLTVTYTLPSGGYFFLSN